MPVCGGHPKGEGGEGMAELAFLPFAGQGVQRRKETYPSWMKKAKYSQLSRTVVVTGLKWVPPAPHPPDSLHLSNTRKKCTP